MHNSSRTWGSPKSGIQNLDFTFWTLNLGDPPCSKGGAYPQMESEHNKKLIFELSSASRVGLKKSRAKILNINEVTAIRTKKSGSGGKLGPTLLPYTTIVKKICYMVRHNCTVQTFLTIFSRLSRVLVLKISRVFSRLFLRH